MTTAAPLREMTVQSPASYQDVLDAPQNLVAELIHGVRYLHPRPDMVHALAASSLGVEIGAPFHRGRGGPGGWWILDEPELHFGGDVLVPDLAGWRRERMPVVPDTAWVELVPDWACEILSPSTRRVDLVEKRAIYGRDGVRHLWLVDPAGRTLEVFELRDESWSLVAALRDDSIVSEPPFEAIEFPLTVLSSPGSFESAEGSATAE